MWKFTEIEVKMREQSICPRALLTLPLFDFFLLFIFILLLPFSISVWLYGLTLTFYLNFRGFCVKVVSGVKSVTVAGIILCTVYHVDWSTVYSTNNEHVTLTLWLLSKRMSEGTNDKARSLALDTTRWSFLTSEPSQTSNNSNSYTTAKKTSHHNNSKWCERCVSARSATIS